MPMPMPMPMLFIAEAHPRGSWSASGRGWGWGDCDGERRREAGEQERNEQVAVNMSEFELDARDKGRAAYPCPRLYPYIRQCVGASAPLSSLTAPSSVPPTHSLLAWHNSRVPLLTFNLTKGYNTSRECAS